MFIVTKVKEITKASASVGLLLATAVVSRELARKISVLSCLRGRLFELSVLVRP